MFVLQVISVNPCCTTSLLSLEEHDLEKKGNTVAPAALQFGCEESEYPPTKSSSLYASVISVKLSNPKTKLNASGVMVC